MDSKITGLDQIDEVALGDKIPLVDVSDTTQSAQGSTKYATVEQIMALSTAQANPAVENSYLTVALLLAGQGNQTEGYLQYVADASAHPDVTSGEAYFEYLGTTDGDVDDYRLLSAAEASEVVSTPPINRFFINDIETTTATTVTNGQIHITYENVNDTVTDILFPQDFSGYLADMNVLDGEDVNFAVAIFNRTTNEWLGAVDVSFSVVNTNYYKVSTDKETMPIASITQYDVVEVYFSWYPVTVSGDMTKAVYDPNTVEGDAFDMDNMVEGTTNKILSAAERTKLSGIEASADVTDATNVAAAGATMDTDTDVSGNGWVLDEDDMSSDSATKVPTQQSVKAYVDANSGAGGGAFTTTSNVTSNSEGSYTNDSFVFGSPSLNDNGDVNNDYRFLFDKSNGSFRAGRCTGTQWDSRGFYSVGFGLNSISSGQSSIAAGESASASSSDAIALGKNTISSNSGAISIGNGCEATAANSVAIGRDCDATSTSAVSIGRASVASGAYSVALGQLNSSTGQFSFVCGNNATSQAYMSGVFGRFNELLGSTSAWTTTDPVFQIGIGADSGSRADAFRVLKDGVVLAPTVSTSQIDSASNKVLVTKEWIQNAELGAVNWSHFGDSTSSTGGSDWIEDLDTLVNFASVNNNATSGDRIDQQVDDLDTLLAGDAAYFEDYEIASILIGVNDFQQDRDLGTRASAVGGATVAGQMRDWIEKVLTSNPAIDIYVMTPWEMTNGNYQSDNSATIPWSIKDLRQLYHEICTDYQIQCIDLYSLMGINSITGSTLTDGVVHLTATGETKIIPIVKNAFINKNNPPLFS